MADSKPLVLLIDEIDTLVGDTLLSVLRQLRTGYPRRPGSFPQSVILCGVRDVRDYRIHSTAQNALVLGGSAFNIKSKSLRLGDFTETETQALLAQHTEETGQAFAPEALELIWTRTAGQPWLVNALCREACFDSEAGRDRSRTITADDILDAQERLILARVTHLDNLADKLREERVRRVVAPMLTGAADRDSYADRGRDVEYARDLGLLAQDDAKRIANPIYAEVIPRELTWVAQDDVEEETSRYVDAGGDLDVDRLLEAFQQFFREHSEHWTQRFDRYREAGPQLLLQAYLQKVVNGGGRIERGIRPGPRARGSADSVAARGTHAPVRRGVQGAPRRAGADDPRGRRADARLHGPLRGGVRPPDRLRPLGRQDVGGEDLPSRADRGRRAGHRLGHVTDGFSTRSRCPPPTSRTACESRPAPVTPARRGPASRGCPAASAEPRRARPRRCRPRPAWDG